MPNKITKFTKSKIPLIKKEDVASATWWGVGYGVAITISALILALAFI